MSAPDEVAPRYPSGTVRSLLSGEQVTGPTRAAIEPRLTGGTSAPRFFDPAAFATLAAVCARLVPQPERPHPVDLAPAIDARLAEGKGDGWRFASMPQDGEAYRRGLDGVNETATAMFGTHFVALDAGRQDAVLLALQRGEAAGDAWTTNFAMRFFEELLAESAEVYYSHPLAQEEIGYVGMADAPGWERIGLDELEEREPRALGEPAS